MKNREIISTLNLRFIVFVDFNAEYTLKIYGSHLDFNEAQMLFYKVLKKNRKALDDFGLVLRLKGQDKDNKTRYLMSYDGLKLRKCDKLRIEVW